MEEIALNKHIIYIQMLILSPYLMASCYFSGQTETQS